MEFRVEELEDEYEVEMEREEAEKTLEVSRLERWEPKVSLFTETIKAKEDDLDKAFAKIKLLENFMAWQNYVACKQLQELPVLPKKTNKFKLLGSKYKIKSKVNQTKEVVKEKFNAYILQRVSNMKLEYQISQLWRGNSWHCNSVLLKVIKIWLPLMKW